MRNILVGSIAYLGIASTDNAMYSAISKLLAVFDQYADKTAAKSLLSKKELEVLTELISGDSNKTIARRLDVSDNAIKFHLKNIYRKLGVPNRRIAAELARSLQLISS